MCCPPYVTIIRSSHAETLLSISGYYCVIALGHPIDGSLPTPRKSCPIRSIIVKFCLSEHSSQHSITRFPRHSNTFTSCFLIPRYSYRAVIRLFAYCLSHSRVKRFSFGTPQHLKTPIPPSFFSSPSNLSTFNIQHNLHHHPTLHPSTAHILNQSPLLYR